MKKLLAMVLIISTLLTLLCSCDGSDNETTTQSSTTESSTSATTSAIENTTTSETTRVTTTTPSFIAEKKFEPDRKDLPTKEQILEIKEGMTYSEVVEKIGYPQRDFGSGIIIHDWDLANGEVARISFINANFAYDWVFFTVYKVIFIEKQP